jgi:hypothetical protein
MLSGLTKYFAVRFMIYVQRTKLKCITLVKHLRKFISSNAIGPYLKQVQSSSHQHNLFLHDRLTLSSHVSPYEIVLQSKCLCVCLLDDVTFTLPVYTISGPCQRRGQVIQRQIVGSSTVHQDSTLQHI